MSNKSNNNISLILKSQIQNLNFKIKSDEVGKVITVDDNIALVSGLNNVMLGELVIFANDILGMAWNLEEDFVGIILLNASFNIKEGDIVKRTKKLISVPVGDQMLGRVVNALGQAEDLGSQINSLQKKNIFKIAPGVMAREEVNQPLETGIIAIDSMIPIGKGQRELIIGDRQTGKTTVAIDTIINQKNKNVFCVYVAIGQKNSSVAQIVQKLKKENAMKYTTIVIANASDPVSLQYIVPYTGITIAEEWMSQGKDVLIVYDDLSKHAIAYRTISLLLRRPPGREAYPGDVFYLHSQLLERSARLNKENNGGSITALPIIETQAGDLSSYIPTNVISITDGQIFMMTDLFNSGQKPAIDAGYSVSRVGSTAQTKFMKQISTSLKLELAQYNEMVIFTQFGTDLDFATQNILSHGSKILEILKQNRYSPLNQIDQSIILLALKTKLTNPIPVLEIVRFKEELINFFNHNIKAKKLKKILITQKAFSNSLLINFKFIICEFVKLFIKTIKGYKASENMKLPNIKKPNQTLKKEIK